MPDYKTTLALIAAYGPTAGTNGWRGETDTTYSTLQRVNYEVNCSRN
jgi:hypothetical protein